MKIMVLLKRAMHGHSECRYCPGLQVKLFYALIPGLITNAVRLTNILVYETRRQMRRKVASDIHNPKIMIVCGVVIEILGLGSFPYVFYPATKHEPLCFCMLWVRL
jgi:hypothetical protein